MRGRRLRRAAALGGTALAGLLALAPGSAALAQTAPDPFYLDLVRLGRESLARGDARTAARELRLGCFGLLDHTDLLGACLARLAIAQARAGDRDGLSQTASRLNDLEQRFGGLRGAELTPTERAELASSLTKHLPAATLAALPSFAPPPTTATPPAPKERAPSRQRERVAAPTEPAVVPTPRAKSTATPLPPSPAARPAGSPMAAPETELSAEEKAKLAAARQALSRAKTLAELERALALAEPIAAQHAQVRDAQLLVGELAYRASRWISVRDALLRAGLPEAEGSLPQHQFYLAVALYELGDRERSAAALRPIQDRVQRTPFVDGYIRKILGGVAPVDATRPKG